jgi:molybdopterin molybdotransferase
VAAEPFARVVAVDFSANATPKLGADSIWVAEGAPRTRTLVRNLATRRELEGDLEKVAAKAGRTLVIIDVALGWPEGLAALVAGSPRRHDVARLLGDEVTDGPRNENNRFEVASELNRRAGVALYWGHPQGRAYRFLSPTKRPPRGLAPWDGEHLRRLERACGGTIKSPLQLYGNGSVGSQSMLAQAMLERLRRAGVPLALWPYDGDGATVVVAEEFFARRLFDFPRGTVRDERQVRGCVSVLRPLLEGAPTPLVSLSALRQPAREVVLHEEGWLARLEVAAEWAGDGERGRGGDGGDGRRRPRVRL